MLALLVLVALASCPHGSMLAATSLCLSHVWVWCCLHVVLTVFVSVDVQRSGPHCGGSCIVPWPHAFLSSQAPWVIPLWA